MKYDEKDKNTQDNYTRKYGSTTRYSGHKLRTGKGQVIDRSRLGETDKYVGDSREKLPNQYSGHTFKNKKEKYRLDGHKMLYHLDRVSAWKRGERIVPVHIDMGISKYCNMGCIYCIGVTQGMKKGIMIEGEALMRFIDDAGILGVRSIAYIGDGEPTVNPALYDVLVRTKNRGIDAGLGTNGVILDMNRSHDILRSCTFLRINLSAAERKSFRKIHQISEKYFDLLVDKIKTLVELRNKNNYDCTLGIQMVLIPENYDQVLKLAKLGNQLDVDYLQIKQSSDTEYGELGINYEDYKKVEDDLKEAEKLSHENYIVQVKWNKINIMEDTDVYRAGIRKYDICYGTPFLGQISGDGKVYPCGPFFGKERFLMGDISKDSYYDIVKSDLYWKVQQDIVDNVDVHFDCTVGCRQDYINKFLWDIKNPPEHVNFI